MRGVALAVWRLVRGAVSLAAAFTVAFFAVAFTPNPNLWEGFGYVPQLVPAPDRRPPFADREPALLGQYAEWFGRVATLDLGVAPGSLTSGPVPVDAVVGEALLYTAVYFLPALAVALAAGTLLQLYAVSSASPRLSARTTLVGIVAVSLPSFLLAWLFNVRFPIFVFRIVGEFVPLGYDSTQGPLSARNLRAALWPFITMTIYLFGIQLRYAGSELREYAQRSFVKTARAKGAGSWRVGLHVFPHAAVHLLTAFLSDALGLVLVGLYVIEWITGTPGFGLLTIDAVGARIPGLIFAVILLPVVVAVAVNVAQDIYYELFDPRVSG